MHYFLFYFKGELTLMPHTLLCPSRVLASMTPWLLVRTGSLVGSLACSVFNLILMQLCLQAVKLVDLSLSYLGR